jgi:hypothetical protein
VPEGGVVGRHTYVRPGHFRQAVGVRVPRKRLS